MIRLPSAADPAVSVIVLLDGAAELGERCLRAIAAAEDSVPFETVVLLNKPDPPLEELVRKGTSGGKVIVSGANAGPGVGWNLGAAVARAPRLATLHEDSAPDPDWLAPLCEVMEESGAGAVGSRLYNEDGSVQNCGWVLFSDASHQPLTAAVAPEVAASTEPTPADMLSGASMMVDREALRANGGWDERFHPAVFVDIDVSTATWSQGRPVLSVPASRVRHESGAFDRRPGSLLTGSQLRIFLLERHRDRFLEKWGAAVRELAPPPADLGPETVRAAVQAALPHTRERLARVRSEGVRAGGAAAKAELRFSGLADPVREEGDGLYAVAPEVEQALDAAEATLVDEYFPWLTGRAGKLAGYVNEATAELARRQQVIAELEERIAGLERNHDELAARLNAILNGPTWRLRSSVVRTIQRAKSLFGAGGETGPRA